MDFDKFDGIVEIDETYFLYSEKGKRNITERKPRKRGGKSKHILLKITLFREGVDYER